MTGKLRNVVLLTAIGCALVTALCHGDVFIRRGATDGSPAGSGLERTAYKAAMSVNSGKGQLKVLGLSGDFDAAVATLRATLFAGKEDHLKAGDGLAFGIVRRKDIVVRVLVTEAGGKCVVFKLEQSPEEFADSFRQTSSLRLKELPVYPGSMPVFSAGNDETDSILEISRANTDPATAWNVMDSGMRRARWVTMAKPEQGASPAGGMGVYVRGKEICCVMVRKSAEGGVESLIGLMLHQRKNRNGENGNEN